MKNIQERVKHVIKKHNLIGKNSKIVIGVSGGADSVCLLYLLNNLKKELNFTLHIAHFDHKLRKESGKDSQFVKKLGEKLNIPTTVGRASAKGFTKNLSLEEAARNARLFFLSNVAAKVGAKMIALAHNFDDQAETVLMRILRGTGLAGLSGIPSKRSMGTFEIIHPLLEIKRKEIERYLTKKQISFCIDKSNSNEIYLRNKIRHSLLPLIEKDYNKNIREVLFNLAQSAGYDYDYLKYSASRFLKNSTTKLNLSKLIKLHPSIMRLKLREAISSLQGNTRRITFRHIQEIENLILSRPRGSIVNLPKGICVIKKDKTLEFISR
jgi:tRNA(Ile)-lysidine synthase